MGWAGGEGLSSGWLGGGWGGEGGGKVGGGVPKKRLIGFLGRVNRGETPHKKADSAAKRKKRSP